MIYSGPIKKKGNLRNQIPRAGGVYRVSGILIGEWVFQRLNVRRSMVGKLLVPYVVPINRKVFRPSGCRGVAFESITVQVHVEIAFVTRFARFRSAVKEKIKSGYASLGLSLVLILVLC